ncbi:MAG TPA: methionine--tRNA ligase [Candidatus Nealsonbacteria bacterium]|uniref:methionine--tRNA ligase n=1 Tax=marine sediment metagenome TaxID=412755 RepID=A0A0F9XXD5_9ZZZZ|nr:methionine--tRNA ligase [Candidatus Nealsonbacteria bacterium]HEB46652.1 methionine--tRNA ligase [Candidatus Nealsonbacteria bacterium]
MLNQRKKFYITTSIIYTNAFPHIGFAFESIQADVIARYHRLLGEEVFFLTGTDEHGAKVVKAAEEEKRNPEEFVDQIVKKVKELKKTLNLSNDDFIRTTDQKKHWPTVKKVWLKLKENGDIYKKKYKGFYCSGCEAFITKKDLINGECILHKQKPEVIEEENYFFRLSKYSKEIEKAIKEDRMKIIPGVRKNEILSFIRQGLKDVSFSRPRKDLKWGIPVPDDKNQTIYVWTDALTNYISALGYDKNSSEFKKYWPADIHCIGKDILRFHAAIWPGILFSLGLELPKNIFVHGFISVEGQKMSKSLGNVIDPFKLVKKYGTDPVRYFLLKEIPPTEDGDFTYEKFEKRYNADLSSGLGNLVARILTLAEKIDIKAYPLQAIQLKTDEIRQSYKKSLDEFKFNKALSSVWELISFCDKYIEKEKPWENKNQKVIQDLLFTLSSIAFLLQPFLPETSEKIFQQLGVDIKDKKRKFKPEKGKSLFPRLAPWPDF